MVIPCLLCPNGSFSDCDQLMTSLTRLVNLPLQCPMPYCSYNELGLDNMIRHLASHAHQDFQDHNNLDNLDQVRDANGIFRKKKLFTRSNFDERSLSTINNVRNDPKKMSIRNLGSHIYSYIGSLPI